MLLKSCKCLCIQWTEQKKNSRWHRRQCNPRRTEVMFNVKSMQLIRTTNSPPPRPSEEQRFVICNWSEMKGQLTVSGQLPQGASWHNSEAIRSQWSEGYFWLEVYQMDRYQRRARLHQITRMVVISLITKRLFKLGSSAFTLKGDNWHSGTLNYQVALSHATHPVGDPININ